jgi:hypothetical protein
MLRFKIGLLLQKYNAIVLPICGYTVRFVFVSAEKQPGWKTIGVKVRVGELPLLNRQLARFNYNTRMMILNRNQKLPGPLNYFRNCAFGKYSASDSQYTTNAAIKHTFRLLSIFSFSFDLLS